MEETVHDGTGPALLASRFEYDKNGNRTVAQTGEEIATTLYDGHNNPIVITNALGKETHITYNTKFVNALGQEVLQTTTTDPLGYQTIDTYDAANRLAETRERRNPLGKKIALQTLFYDLSGNPCVTLDEVIQEGKVNEVIRTEWTYTTDNQIETLIEAVGTPQQRITRHTYKCGQKETTTKPDGVSLHHTYDDLGRLKKLTSSDNTISHTYEYNKLDLVTESKDGISKKKTTRKYDSLNQLEQENLANGLTLEVTPTIS